MEIQLGLVLIFLLLLSIVGTTILQWHFQVRWHVLLTAQNNMLYFLLMQWLRKDVTLLCSSLTVDVRPYNYTLRTNDRNIECAVGRLASGIRRHYLANTNVWHRN
jgi:hypothetical protein